MDRTNNNDKEKLRLDVEKRIKTTMIGALDSFEKKFGYIWGINKPLNEPLTEDEQVFLEMYEYIRQEVMDRGHAQIRAFNHEYENYNVEWLKYRYQFDFRRKP